MIKSIFLFIFTFILLCVSSSFAADQGPIAEGMCVIYALVTGNIAKTVGVIGVAALGIGLFLGRLNWGVAVAVGVGVVLVFGAPGVVEWLTGKKIEENCKNVKANSSGSSNGGSRGAGGSANVFTGLAEYTQIKSDISDVENKKAKKLDEIKEKNAQIQIINDEIELAKSELGGDRDEFLKRYIGALERGLEKTMVEHEDLVRDAEQFDDQLKDLDNKLKNRKPTSTEEAAEIKKEIDSLLENYQKLLDKKEEEDQFYEDWAQTEQRSLSKERADAINTIVSKEIEIANLSGTQANSDEINQIKKQIEEENKKISQIEQNMSALDCGINRDKSCIMKLHQEQAVKNWVKETNAKEEANIAKIQDDNEINESKIQAFRKDIEEAKESLKNASGASEQRTLSTNIADSERSIKNLEAKIVKNDKEIAKIQLNLIDLNDDTRTMFINHANSEVERLEAEIEEFSLKLSADREAIKNASSGELSELQKNIDSYSNEIGAATDKLDQLKKALQLEGEFDSEIEKNLKTIKELSEFIKPSTEKNLADPFENNSHNDPLLP